LAKFAVEVIMSVQQKHQPSSRMTDNNEPSTLQTSHHITPEPSTDDPSKAKGRAQALFHWLLSHSFSPNWLPKSLRHPLVGYIVALVLQIIAIFVTFLLVQIYPSYSFTSLLAVLAIALVALNWGAGPSLLATFVGALLLTYAVKTPHSLTFDPKSLVELLIFLLVGFTISIVASRFERTRRNADSLATSLMTERARLEAVIEAVPDAISIHDAQGTIVRLNKMGLQNAGSEHSKDTVTAAQRNFAIRAPSGETLPLEAFPVSRALQGEIVSGVEINFLDASGQDRYASLSAAPLHDVEGNIDGAIVVTHDVTRLYQSEREAAARANELEAIFETMTDSIFVFDSNGRMLRMNAAARILFALDQPPEHYSRLIQEHRLNFAPLDEHGRPLPEEQWPLYHVLKGETLTSANAQDVRLRSRDGAEYLLNISGAPMRNKAGEIIGALCICRDVTERRQLEKRTQSTLNALLAMAEALVLVPDSSNIVTGQLTSATIERPPQTSIHRIAHRIAELTCSVLGCQRVSISAVDPETEILRSIAVVGLSPELEAQWWAEQHQQQARLGEGLPPELLSRLQANEVFLIDMTEPPFNAAPNPYSIQVVLNAPMSVGDQIVGVLSLDYGGAEHEYSQEEIALAKAVARLAALVIERERLLRERAEARATELALREANRRMDDFLGMTSHELKTPLTSIKGNTQLTVRQLRNSLQNIEKMQHMLESTERQVKLLDRLVDDLLDISRTRTNQLELHVTSCNIAALVHEAVEEQRQAWPNRSITLNVLTEPVDTISADSDRIKQVIMNYLTNALKYSANDRPVYVTVRKEAEQVCVAVKDEGVGLSPDEQAHIWERFHRASGVEVQSTSQTSMMGLGLGLYICKAIIDQHHGRVGVDSTPGMGSTFWFTLTPDRGRTG